MNVFLVSPDLNKDTNWYPDSGASNHVTNEFGNLTTGAEYFGGNKVHVGNGMGLDVHHIGYSLLKSSFSSSNIFLLKNLLHVPQITKNLISVSQFAKDNAIFFEFHPFDCFVKDLKTGQTLITGKVTDELSLGKASSVPMTPSGPVDISSTAPPAQVIHTSITPTYIAPCTSFDSAHNIPSVLDIWH